MLPSIPAEYLLVEYLPLTGKFQFMWSGKLLLSNKPDANESHWRRLSTSKNFPTLHFYLKMLFQIEKFSWKVMGSSFRTYRRLDVHLCALESSQLTGNSESLFCTRALDSNVQPVRWALQFGTEWGFCSAGWRGEMLSKLFTTHLFAEGATPDPSGTGARPNSCCSQWESRATNS